MVPWGSNGPANPLLGSVNTTIDGQGCVSILSDSPRSLQTLSGSTAKETM